MTSVSTSNENNENNSINEVIPAASPTQQSNVSPSSPTSPVTGGISVAPNTKPVHNKQQKNSSNSNTDAYLQDLLRDQELMKNFHCFIHLPQLIDAEINRVRSEVLHIHEHVKLNLDDLPPAEGPLVTRQTKVFVPVDEHPNYNFVGRLLGPGGTTAKQFEKDLNCKIMVRGKGSLRDKKKEEQKMGQPNWEHLSEELHVLVSVEDTENRVDARLARVADCLQDFFHRSALTPENEDTLKKMQLKEVFYRNEQRRPVMGNSGYGNMSRMNSAASRLATMAALHQSGGGVGPSPLGDQFHLRLLAALQPLLNPATSEYDMQFYQRGGHTAPGHRGNHQQHQGASTGNENGNHAGMGGDIGGRGHYQQHQYHYSNYQGSGTYHSNPQHMNQGGKHYPRSNQHRYHQGGAHQMPQPGQFIANQGSGQGHPQSHHQHSAMATYYNNELTNSYPQLVAPDFILSSDSPLMVDYGSALTSSLNSSGGALGLIRGPPNYTLAPYPVPLVSAAADAVNAGMSAPTAAVGNGAPAVATPEKE